MRQKNRIGVDNPINSNLTEEDREKIEKGIRKKYAKVADSPEGQFQYPTGKEGLERLGYDKNLIEELPDSVAASYCGVGNPFSLGQIKTGEYVLDIGCGAGVDTILASIMTGPDGKVFGVDFVLEMLYQAVENSIKTGVENIVFQQATGEKLPFDAGIFNVVISNGAINLIVDKERAVAEIYRVLKPGGRLMVADQILISAPPEDKNQILKSWSQ